MAAGLQLECELRRDLNAARAASAPVDRARAAAQRAGHESEVRVVRGTAAAVRVGELRRVGQIHRFQPELQAHALGELDGLGQGEIQVEESRSDHRIATNIAYLLGRAGNLIGSSCRTGGSGGCGLASRSTCAL